VRFVRAEGLAMGDAKKAEALVSAAEQAHDATQTAANQSQVAMAA
jgi:FMN-dependent NADH-azoreductase